jgi:hypothetical protein
MAKVDSFLDSLITYDKENIHPEVIKAIQPYLKDAEFDPEFVRTKSGAAAGKNFKYNFRLLSVLAESKLCEVGKTWPRLDIEFMLNSMTTVLVFIFSQSS